LGWRENTLTKALSARAYPTDVTDEEWAFCAPYLTLMKDDAPQIEHSLRSVFDALRHMVRAGCPWRMAGCHWLGFLTLMLNCIFHQSA
jgi:hypothetical protein